MEKQLEDMTDEQRWQLFPIILNDYNPAWPGLYQTEAADITETVGAQHVACISHIGSTAVVGMAAKPTIDILLEIKPDTDVQRMQARLCGIGYLCTPQPNNPPPHKTFLKGYTPRGFVGQVFHVHVRYPGDWDELFFRDYLREHPELAREYAALKTALQKKFTHDRDGYTAAKTAFVRDITNRARACYGKKYDVK